MFEYMDGVKKNNCFCGRPNAFVKIVTAGSLEEIVKIGIAVIISNSQILDMYGDWYNIYSLI